MDTAIRLEHVSKSFSGIQAVKDVTLEIKKGELHALIGENGAGKSTILNMLYGLLKPNGGKIYINEKPYDIENPIEALKYGILKIHQEVSYASSLTVGQNILIGQEPHKGGLIAFKELNSRVNAVLDQLGCRFRSSDLITGLSVGEMQMMSLARVLLLNPHIVLLDEPTASLSGPEIERLLSVIKDFKAKGITMIFVSHKLDEVLRVSDRISVLRDGSLVYTVDAASATQETLIKSMVGRDISAYGKRMDKRCVQPEVVLEVKNFSSKEFSNISFKLHKGEILGFAGLVGAKRTEVMRALYGADTRMAGEVYLHGRKVELNRPEQALAAGIALLPENRKTQGFVKDTANKINVALSSLKKYCSLGVLNNKRIYQVFDQYAERIKLSPKKPDLLTENLSGGNQQKVVLAKLLASGVDILIFDEPTKGIDVGAKSEIYRLMEMLVKDGKSIIMVSSELPEVIGMSDRVIVMNNGRITGEMVQGEFSEESIMQYALGGNS